MSTARATPHYRLARHALTRFWFAHAWAGAITALLVHVMFFLGAFVLFYRPLTIWEEPLIQRSPVEVRSLERIIQLAQPQSDEFYVYLPSAERALPKVGYYLPGTSLWRMWWIDPENGTRIAEREKVAAFIYDLHYLWHDLTGYWLQYGAGVLVFGFLLALVTGALVHLGRFRRQLFQFRPGRDRRVLWSDLHKVAGVFGLPFQLVYAITGSMMVLSPLLFQLSIHPVFGGDTARAVATAGALVDDHPATDVGPAMAPLSLDDLAARAYAAEPRLHLESVVYRGYGHARGTVHLRGPIEGQPFGDGTVSLNAGTGAVEKIETPDRETAVGALARWIHGLHTVEYGGTLARWLLFVLALGGCATLLTGNWIWIERRSASRPGRFTTVLAKVTAGIGVGCFTAVAALFLASRVIPLDSPDRIHQEEFVMASVLALTIGVAFVARNTGALWWRGLAAAGASFALVPMVAARQSEQGLFGAGPRHPSVFAVDAALLTGGLVLLACAALLRRHQRVSDGTRDAVAGPSVESPEPELAEAAGSWSRGGLQ